MTLTTRRLGMRVLGVLLLALAAMQQLPAQAAPVDAAYTAYLHPDVARSLAVHGDRALKVVDAVYLPAPDDDGWWRRMCDVPNPPKICWLIHEGLQRRFVDPTDPVVVVVPDLVATFDVTTVADEVLGSELVLLTDEASPYAVVDRSVVAGHDEATTIPVGSARQVVERSPGGRLAALVEHGAVWTDMRPLS